MKKFATILLAIVLSLSALTFAACQPNNDTAKPTEENLAGTWKTTAVTLDLSAYYSWLSTMSSIDGATPEETLQMFQLTEADFEGTREFTVDDLKDQNNHMAQFVATKCFPQHYFDTINSLTFILRKDGSWVVDGGTNSMEYTYSIADNNVKLEVEDATIPFSIDFRYENGSLRTSFLDLIGEEDVSSPDWMKTCMFRFTKA